jgi:pyruvate,water dikinase
MEHTTLTLPFDEIGETQAGLVGGKCSNLAKLRQRLAQKGIRVPNGFAITTNSWRAFLAGNVKLQETIKSSLLAIKWNDAKTVKVQSAKIRHAVVSAKMPVNCLRLLSLPMVS